MFFWARLSGVLFLVLERGEFRVYFCRVVVRWSFIFFVVLSVGGWVGDFRVSK